LSVISFVCSQLSLIRHQVPSLYISVYSSTSAQVDTATCRYAFTFESFRRWP